MATNGIVLIKPTSVAKTGGSSTATINAGGSVTFGLCSTLSLNGVFSSLYDNYIIDARYVGSTFQALTLRMRGNESDNSTASSYVAQQIVGSSTTISSQRVTGASAFVSAAVDTQRSGSHAVLYGPHLSQPTAGRFVNVSGDVGGVIVDWAFTHNQSTAYDGFSLFAASGTFSGLIKVYGLVK